MANTEEKNNSKSYYDEILQKLGIKLTDYEMPTEESLKSDFEGILRPEYDKAIEKRNKTARENMAELDADASSRGMLGSTFISSMKSRELENASDDISQLETNYAQALADKVYTALSQAKENKLKHDEFNENLKQNAIEWYSDYLIKKQQADNASSYRGGYSSGRSSGSNSGSNNDNSQGNSLYGDLSDWDKIYAGDPLYDHEPRTDVIKYFKQLDTYSMKELRKLLYSNERTWAIQREVFLEDCGYRLFRRLILIYLNGGNPNKGVLKNGKNSGEEKVPYIS